VHESKGERETSMSQLMEEILSRENMTLAYKKVRANKGASGVDGISVDEVHEYLKENWASIKERIQKRKYRPQPVLRVETPKPYHHPLWYPFPDLNIGLHPYPL
jgi:retron-type reverse transcriptase